MSFYAIFSPSKIYKHPYHRLSPGFQLSPISPRFRHDSQRHRVKHVLVEPLLPSPVLGQEHLQLGIFQDHRPAHLRFACPAVAGSEFLEGAGIIVDEPELLSPGNGPYLRDDHVHQGSPLVVAEKRLFRGNHAGTEILDQPENDLPDVPQGFVGRVFRFDNLDPVVDESSVVYVGNAHEPGAGIDG